MYSSEKNPGINWKDLIIKAIFLVVFLLLLVWLFPKVPNMKPFYSNVFRENIKYMQDAAESYYTTEKLPKNIGDSAEMTLQEMINKNLILPFVDQDGNECDTYSSYVQVRKNQNDYTLKVNLVCPTESNYVEKTLGCYDYCDTCKEELEYQFKKETTSDRTTYSCPDGGVLSGTMCYVYKTSSYKATETTSKGEYHCPDGGTLSGTTCYVSANSSYDAPISVGGYSCRYGGTLSGTTCYVSDRYSYAASTEYSCPSGSTLSGNMCYRNNGSTSTNALIDYYRCPDGSRSSNVVCKTSTTTPALIDYYECPDGSRSSTATCKTTTQGTPFAATPKTTSKKVKYTSPRSGSAYTSLGTTTEYVCTSSANCPGYVTYYNYLYKTTTYSCPSGSTLNNSTKMCIPKASTSTTQGKAHYYCPTGTQSGTSCIVSGSATYGTPVYYCPTGTLSGNKCYTSGGTSSFPATPSKVCPAGTTKNGNVCVVENSYTYQAEKGDDKRYCPTGTLSGTKCIVDNSYTYQAEKSNGQTVYTCPDGGELKDKSCYTSFVSKEYKASASTKKVTSVSYKWSKEQTLEGWTPTGETRATGTQMAKN